VETFVSGDEFVGKGETGHETAFLEPKDGGEGTREEDTLDDREGDETLGKRGALVRDPAECPVGLFANAWD
jgi:hypothetical protein